ncbi:hypothetical protein [uncultured Adlercreutzia sp.]|uniref:hypothetical protein n=1 Tax=uncultured Adlercreutzia sp. TaxID=875803 RepID=UPI0025ED40C2|nr:hypothetical protein [uncultured Adlercreutzia sp.]
MNASPETRNLEDLRSLTRKHGAYTVSLLGALHDPKPLPTYDALRELTAEIVPFNERLTRFVSEHLQIDDDVKKVKKALRNASKGKGFEFSSANLSQWITKDKWNILVSPKSIFKLCLALELDLAEAQRFCYECLYQTWFNYRVAEEAVFIFFIGAQHVFKERTYAAAMETIEWVSANTSVPEVCGLPDSAENYTRVLGGKIRSLAEDSFSDKDHAMRVLRDFLRSNMRLFTGIQQSVIRTYDLFFSEGGIGIQPLTALYKDIYGFTLPVTSYLDAATYIQEVPQKKRLLWGTINRREWLRDNDRDFDIIQDQEFRTEEHAVGRMKTRGIPRGNIVALLFFQFCLDHNASFGRGANRSKLFDAFYQRANAILIDECGMMPLHPRKPLDSLFMRSIVNSHNENPIEYLNRFLEDFYAN